MSDVGRWYQLSRIAPAHTFPETAAGENRGRKQSNETTSLCWVILIKTSKTPTTSTEVSGCNTLVRRQGLLMLGAFPLTSSPPPAWLTRSIYRSDLTPSIYKSPCSVTFNFNTGIDPSKPRSEPSASDNIVNDSTELPWILPVRDIICGNLFSLPSRGRCQAAAAWSGPAVTTSLKVRFTSSPSIDAMKILIEIEINSLWLPMLEGRFYSREMVTKKKNLKWTMNKKEVGKKGCGGSYFIIN